MLSNYAPKQLAAMHKAFTVAKKHLSYGLPDDNNVPYICVAILSAEGFGEITHFDATSATKHIDKCLGTSSPSVSSWLWDNVPEIRTMKDASFCHQQIQAYRHRWLDHLIQETEGY